MDHIIGYELIVKGRISTVRWLEQPPYNARKVRGERGYCNYVVAFADQDAADQLALKLEGSELAAAFRDDALQVQTGVWTEVRLLFDMAAIRADEAAQHAAEEAQPIHPGWQGFADRLRQRGERVTNDICHDFAVEQIRKLEATMYRRRADVRAIRQILHDVEWAPTNEAAAQCYADARDQMRAWSAKYK